MVVVMHLKLFGDCPKHLESKMYILAVQLQQLALSAACYQKTDTPQPHLWTMSKTEV